jgi:hypothetical protein
MKTKFLLLFVLLFCILWSVESKENFLSSIQLNPPRLNMSTCHNVTITTIEFHLLENHLYILYGSTLITLPLAFLIVIQLYCCNFEKIFCWTIYDRFSFKRIFLFLTSLTNLILFSTISYFYQQWIHNLVCCSKFFFFETTLGFYFIFTISEVVILVSSFIIWLYLSILCFYGCCKKETIAVKSKSTICVDYSIIVGLFYSMLNFSTFQIGVYLLFTFYQDGSCRNSNIFTLAILLISNGLIVIAIWVMNIFSCFCCCCFGAKEQLKASEIENREKILLMDNTLRNQSQISMKNWGRTETTQFLIDNGFKDYSKEMSIYTMDSLQKHYNLQDSEDIGIKNEFHKHSLICLLNSLNVSFPHKYCNFIHLKLCKMHAIQTHGICTV